MKTQKPFSRIMEVAGKYKSLVYASWILSVISALVALIPFIYIWRIIKELFSEELNPLKMKNFGIAACIYAILSFVIYIVALYCSHLAAFRAVANFRKLLLKKISLLPLGFIEKNASGKIRKIIMEASGALETYIAHRLPDKAGALITPLALLFMLFYFDWKLGIFSLIPVFMGFVVMSFMTGADLKKKMNEYQNALDSMSSQAVEYVRGIPVVKTFGQTIFSFHRLKKSIDDYSNWTISYTKSLRMPMVMYTTCINSVFVFLIAAGMYFSKNNTDKTFLLNLIFYIIITPIISITLSKIMYLSEDGMIVGDAMKRMDEILMVDKLDEKYDEKKPEDFSIEFKDVSFAYDDEKNVINHLNLKINEGQLVAFVGPSGGGKSTLASLVTRFYDVKEGAVLIGGKDIKTFSKEELMNTISFVFQNAHLIKASILDNLRLAKKNATKDEVMTALKKAQCMDIIEKAPDGIDILVGSDGVHLSGGEIQRLCIARVFLKNSPIVILDEATVFSDPDNEVKVREAFKELAKEKTVIMIAHRLSSIIDASCIFVIENGKIVEQGSFAELKNKGEVFTKMWADYQKSVLWRM